MIAARIAFSDPAQGQARATHIEAHKKYLRNGSIRVLQSGPFSCRSRHGALITAEVDTLDELQAFSDGDPFVIHRVYEEIYIVEWTITLERLHNED